MAAAAMMAASTAFAAGDETNGHAYFTKAELPDMTRILPPFPEFELARSRAELKEKTGGATSVPLNSVRSMEQEGTARIYRLDGSSATSATRGIVIENGRKVAK